MSDAAQLLARSHELRERALVRTPGGVHSNVRLGGPQVFIEYARDAWLYDVDGENYVDYLLGQGPNFLGHAPRHLVEAVSSACERGLIFGGQHKLEVEASEVVCEALGWPDMVRFGVSGTESVQAALRLARAATGRKRVIRFEGHYHGWLDNVLAAEGSLGWGTASVGQLPGHLDDFAFVPWNDEERFARAIEEEPDVAAVIMEPIMINAGVIEPAPGYLDAVRALCSKHGVVLIFDEVISGFRLGLGGAAARYGVVPDLATYGKAMAGGWPASALAGRAELMELFDKGGVNHSGTFNGSVVAMAATHATVSHLMDSPPYERIASHGGALMDGLRGIGEAHDLPLRVEGLPMAFHVSFGTAEVTDYRSLQSLDLDRYARLVPELVAHGLWVAGRGVWYVSACHGADELDAALTRFDKTLTDRA
ncbi:aminotransferase class III [Prauserella marina]|uniref:Glutamate-1-semialdehyde 2,1-aminomutase n=1 Tax=Prauserella marina TaxID=530584 RepID=A0A222VTW1_9PSEU|nr:aminotransferase class III-fold pyridoxal phosphate-dependent enzyme [Prauserella marina]ASR37376.1 aminotransferase class III [Prauserella marina]PWV74759.1 glutamate-1-semialdehyde 2,1-aminomutase [Prauserella marina]SDD41430.1 glutamate-1-semialdehyde 2,1-aminomutase [Prauserella marina]